MVGEGNNHPLVSKHLANFKPLTFIGFYNRASILWTPLPNKKVVSTMSSATVSVQHIAQMKDFEAIKALDAEEMTRLMLEFKIFKVEDPNLVREVFVNMLKLREVNLVVREGISISNHVKDLKDISRKSHLYLTIQKFLDSAEGQFYTRRKEILIPRTYLLSGNTFDADLQEMIRDKTQKDLYFANPLIIKPGQFSNRGIGISLAFNMTEAIRYCKETLENRKNTCSVIVQEYISKPLLFKDRKFDVRCYALVVKMFNTVSYYWYSRGYARTSSFVYDASIKDNLKVHLTNEAVQVKGSL